MAVGAHVGSRLNGVEQALAGIEVIFVQIVIEPQPGPLPGGQGEFVGRSVGERSSEKDLILHRFEIAPVDFLHRS